MSFLAALAPAALSAMGGTAADAAGTAAMQGLNSADEAFQVGLYAQQMQHQESMSVQSTMFDDAMDERSENMRQINTLRDVEMTQRKENDSITKKFIQSISE
jgi:hypothetical protein